MLGTVIGIGVRAAASKLKKKQRRRRGLGFASGGPFQRQEPMAPGGGVLARPSDVVGVVEEAVVEKGMVKYEEDPVTGEIRKKPKRRRRRRLLTCGDRSDIAFITATLGKGQAGQTAIASLLARCN